MRTSADLIAVYAEVETMRGRLLDFRESLPPRHRENLICAAGDLAQVLRDLQGDIGDAVLREERSS